MYNLKHFVWPTVICFSALFAPKIIEASLIAVHFEAIVTSNNYTPLTEGPAIAGRNLQSLDIGDTLLATILYESSLQNSPPPGPILSITVFNESDSILVQAVSPSWVFSNFSASSWTALTGPQLYDFEFNTSSLLISGFSPFDSSGCRFSSAGRFSGTDPYPGLFVRSGDTLGPRGRYRGRHKGGSMTRTAS